MKKIRTIETTQISNKHLEKLRVCAYCRVSTDQIDQQNSLSAQVEYYTNLIKSNPTWEFAGIYIDNGISAKNAAKRPEFVRMVQDAENKKIDLIITKSISRFARNTIDCLETVRKLKVIGIAIQSEKEAINTLNSESELMLSILSSVAEEELASISQNLHWSNQQRFKQGKFSVTTKRFLGYDKDQKGHLVINEEQAAAVKRIFKDYLSGLGVSRIVKGLEEGGFINISGKVKWATSSILDIINNEKYVKDSHPAIITQEDFERVQELMVERARAKNNLEGNREKYLKRYAFTGTIECGHCGKTYKRHIDNCGNVAETVSWICSTHIS